MALMWKSREIKSHAVCEGYTGDRDEFISTWYRYCPGNISAAKASFLTGGGGSGNRRTAIRYGRPRSEGVQICLRIIGEARFVYCCA